MVKNMKFYYKYLYLFFFLLYNFSPTKSVELQDIFTVPCIEGSTDLLNKLDLLNSDAEGSYVKEANARSQINELAQYNNIEISYEKLHQEGPSHKPEFAVSLTLGDESYKGIGSSLKSAKEDAASLALKNTKYNQRIKFTNKIKNTPLQELYVLRDKLGFNFDFFLMNPMVTPHLKVLNLKDIKDKNMSFYDAGILNIEDFKLTSPFYVQLNLEEYTFSGKDHTIKGAKQKAAQQAVEAIKNETISIGFCYVDGKNKICTDVKERHKTPASIIHEASLHHRLSLKYREIGVTGPSHKPLFKFECVLGDFVTVAEGPSKKKAKQNAASKMLENLAYLSDNGDTDEGKKKNKRKKNDNFGILDGISNYFSSDSEETSEQNNDLADESKKMEENEAKKPKYQTSYKTKLLEVGENFKFNCQFSTVTNKGAFYSVISLLLDQSYMCLGEGINLKSAEEAAAFNTLKFIRELAVFDIKEDSIFTEGSHLLEANVLFTSKEVSEKN